MGISFARGRLNPTDVLLVHAAPAQLNSEVSSDDGAVLARGHDLMRTASTPIARLRRVGNEMTREDIWPTEADYGTPVMLPGGEVGILQHWWNDARSPGMALAGGVLQSPITVSLAVLAA